MRKLQLAIVGLLIVCGSGGGPAAALAQTGSPASIVIHAVELTPPVTPEGGGVPGLPLRATFSLLDSSGTVVKTDIGKAALLLGDDRYTAKFTKLQTDWSVVLLLDTSGTLSDTRAQNDFRSVRDTLSLALGSAPGNASFAVIPFSDRAPTVQEFTRDHDVLAKKLKSIQVQAGKPACLNDGLYEAIAKVREAPGRRAVLVVTASADNCATRSIQSVVAYAQQNNVELYALGLEGYTTTAQELESFAGPTGGLTAMHGVSDLRFALNNLMDVLSNQWQAVWVLYPHQGPQTAELDVTMPDSLIVTGSLSFESDREYVHPPQVTIVGTAQPTLTGVRINIDLVSGEQIKALHVEVISQDSGRSVYQADLTDFTDSILIPVDNLVKGAGYTLTITALDDQGQALNQSEPLEFQYAPPEADVKIAAVRPPTLEEPDFVITMSVQNLEGVTKYRLWLEDSDTGAGVKGAEATYNAGEDLRLSAQDLETGNYLVHVEILGADDQVLAEAAPFKVAYQRPGVVARLVFWMRQSVVALIGLSLCGIVAVAGLVAVVWLVMPKRTEKIKAVELALPERARRSSKPSAEPVVAAKPAPPPPAEASGTARSARAVPKAEVAPPRPASPPPAAPKAEVAPPRPASPPPAEPPAGFRAVIVLTDPSTTQFKAEIRKSPFSLGRRADNDGVVPLDSSSGVSGNHCVITHVSGQWYVQDDKSTYGTSLNGSPIPKGLPTPIKDGDVLGLGPNAKFQFRTGASA